MRKDEAREMLRECDLALLLDGKADAFLERLSERIQVHVAQQIKRSRPVPKGPITPEALQEAKDKAWRLELDVRGLLAEIHNLKSHNQVLKGLVYAQKLEEARPRRRGPELLNLRGKKADIA